MDPITTAILSWLTGEVGTAGVRMIGSVARRDRQQRALAAIVAKAVDVAVDEVVADHERADVREALLRELPQDADAVGPGDILDLEAAASRVLGPRFELLEEQGYHIDAARLAKVLTRLITQGIQADADRAGPLVPLAERIRHERVATASEATAAASEATVGELRAIHRTLTAVAKDPTVHDTGHERLGRPVADLPGPLALGVHQAVSAGDTQLPVLPEYVPREHDAQLQTLMEAADQASVLIVLAGDSSTGKTRALWEALRRLPGQWRVWSPAGARALNEGLAAAGVGPQTVVWLDDAHNYLGPASQLAEDTAERLIDLVANRDAGPVLVAATLWPERWQQLTAQPRSPSGQAGPVGPEGSSAYVPALFESATYIQVPSAFGTDDLATASGAASRDPRLALALEYAPSGKITQYLAGAPKLIERYRAAPPEARALVDAAVDARRFGHGNRLPERLLLDAAPGYIDSDTWDRLRDDWETKALEAMTQDWRGLPGPITRIRLRPGEIPVGGPEYKLADILEQTGDRDRRYVAPPREFWAAVARDARTEDLFGIGYAAQIRSRRRDAAQIYLKDAAAGDAWALHELALMREEAGDHTGAERLAAKAAFADDCDALKGLAWYRTKAGDNASAERLYYAAVEAGDKESVPILLKMREEAGDHAEAERLALEAARSGDTRSLYILTRMRAKARNFRDAERLALEALNMGDTEPLSEVAAYWASDGNHAEAERQYRLAVGHGDNYALEQLIVMLEDAGDHAEAEHLAQEAARAGNASALRVLAGKRLGASNHADAWRLYQQAADMGDGQALGILAQSWARAGDYDQASQLAIRAAEAGNTSPLEELAQERADAGDSVQAEQLARRAADAGDEDALTIVARIREDAGDHAEADRLAIQAALAGAGWALDEIVEQREEAGDREGAERLALDAAKTMHIEHYSESSTFTFRPVSAIWRLIGMRDSGGDRPGAEKLALRAASNGYTGGLTDLAARRRREGAYKDARRLYELAADSGDADAFDALAAMLKEAGDFAEAELFYQRAINAGSQGALHGLASLWEDTGDHESARHCLRYGLDAEGNAASPWTFDDMDKQ